MRELNENNKNYRIYDDVQDMIEYAKDNPWKNRLLTDPKFMGRKFSDWADVMKCVHDPHPEIAKQVQDLIDNLDDIELPEPQDIKKRVVFDENDGDEIDLDRLNGGQPYWRTLKKKPAYGSQFKRIIINMSARATIKGDALHWRGAVGIALAKIIEEAGYQVEIWAAGVTRGTYVDDSSHRSMLNLKTVNDLIDIEAIGTSISGWFYRSIWQGSKITKGRKVCSGGGTPISLPYGEWMEVFGHEYNKDDNIMISDCFSSHSAQWLLKSTLGKYAGPKPEDPEEDYVKDEAYVEKDKGIQLVVEKTAAEMKREEAQRKRDNRRWEREMDKWTKANKDI